MRQSTFESCGIGASPIVSGGDRTNAGECDFKVLSETDKGVSFWDIVPILVIEFSNCSQGCLWIGEELTCSQYIRCQSHYSRTLPEFHCYLWSFHRNKCIGCPPSRRRCKAYCRRSMASSGELYNRSRRRDRWTPGLEERVERMWEEQELALLMREPPGRGNFYDGNAF
jgi:hypothetical protein